MPSFQGSQRRDVRRRLAAAGHFAMSAAEPSVKTPQASERRPGLYAQMALPEHHASSATRIPIRTLPFLAAVAGLLLPAATLSGLAFFREPLSSLEAMLGERWQNTTAAMRSLLDLRSTQGLAAAAGLASFLLAASLATATRNVRRHRLDDHQGRYRAWGWLSLMLAVGGLTFVLPIGPLVATLMSEATGWDLQSAGRGWWTMLVAAALLPIGAWAVLPLTQRISTSLWLGGALAAWLAAEGVSLGIAAGWQPGLWQLGDASTWQLAGDAARIFAPALAAIGTLVASRGVIREARGLVAPRPARSPKAKQRLSARGPAATEATEATVDEGRAAAANPAHRDDAASADNPTLAASETTPTDKPSANKPASWDEGFDEEEDRQLPSPQLQKNSDSLPSEEDFPATTGTSDASGDDIPDDNRLSKAERSRLRKLSRKNRAA